MTAVGSKHSALSNQHSALSEGFKVSTKAISKFASKGGRILAAARAFLPFAPDGMHTKNA